MHGDVFGTHRADPRPADTATADARLVSAEWSGLEEGRSRHRNLLQLQAGEVELPYLIAPVVGVREGQFVGARPAVEGHP
jgi:hypothetical protein